MKYYKKDAEEEYEIRLTFKCNWNCYYCCEDTHNRKEPDIDQIIDRISQIKNSHIILSGGEPGFVEEHYINQIIQYSIDNNNSLEINTNGLFIRRYPHLLKYFSFVEYHCSEDLDNIVEPVDVDNIIHYIIVVTRSNFHKLDLFLRKNPNIIFYVRIDNLISNMDLGLKCLKYRDRFELESIKNILRGGDFENFIKI